MPARKQPPAAEISLSRDVILEEALRLVDEAGFAALTMRRLAGRLGVDPMAVYYYIPNKQQLIRSLVTAAFAGVAPRVTEGDWRARVNAWAQAYLAIARRHPNLVLQMLTNLDAVAAAVESNQSLDEALLAGGLPQHVARDGAGVLADFVHGYLLGMTPQAPPHGGEAAYFSFALDVILDGLEARKG